jgi:hypothetical protein
MRSRPGPAWQLTSLLVQAGACSEQAPPIAISTLELPRAVRGDPFEAQLFATGGIAPLTFTVASGAPLPAGLTLNAEGRLAGVPQQAGRSTFGVDVTDRSSQRASAGYLLVVDEPRSTDTSTCAAPLSLRLTDEPVIVAGSFSAAVDLESAPCRSGSGREQVYSFVLSDPADLLVEDLASAGTPETLRAVQSRCGAGEAAACAQNGPLLVRRAVGPLFLFIENQTGSNDATYAVSIRKLPPTPAPANDRCEGATPLAFSGPTASLTGTTRGATRDSAENACTSTQAGDVWFSLPMDAPSRVTLSGLQSAQLLGGACTAPSPVACLNGGNCVDVDAGTWLVRVSAEEDFAGTLRREPIPGAPVNDTCERATPLTLAAGRAVVSGRLWGARPDLSLPCATGADVMYELVVTERSNIQVQLDARQGGVTAFLTDEVCSRALVCPTPGTVLRGWAVSPGTYRLVLQGSSASACWEGTFTATVEVTPAAPPPANDTCATAQDVAFTNGLATVDGTTVGGTNDEVTGCSQPAPGPDVMYRLTLASPTRLRVLPTVAFPNMTVSLSSTSCGAMPLACTQQSTGSFETNLLAAGTYFLTVDGVNAAGPFQLIVQQFQ